MKYFTFKGHLRFKQAFTFRKSKVVYRGQEDLEAERLKAAFIGRHIGEKLDARQGRDSMHGLVREIPGA